MIKFITWTSITSGTVAILIISKTIINLYEKKTFIYKSSILKFIIIYVNELTKA
jgi:hypothetical protein